MSKSFRNKPHAIAGSIEIGVTLAMVTYMRATNNTASVEVPAAQARDLTRGVLHEEQTVRRDVRRNRRKTTQLVPT